MKLAKCPHCGAGLDVGSIPAGSAVSCGGCGRPFWIAGGVAPVSAAPGAPVPPASRPRAPAPPPPPPPRRPEPSHAAAGGRRKRSFRPGGRNPLPLLLGAGGVVVVLVLALGWAMFSPKGKPAAGPPAPGAGPAAASAKAAAPQKPKSELEERAESAGMAVPEYLDRMVDQAARSPAIAHTTWDEMKRLGRDDQAVRVLVAGRKAFPHDPWLNSMLGLKDRTKEIQETGGDEQLQDLLADFPDFQHVADLKEAVRQTSGAGWLDDATSTKLDGWLGACRDRAAWLKDPVNERTHRLLTNLRGNPHFAKLSFDAVVQRPFTIFVEDAEPERRDAVRREADRAGKAFLGCYRRFLDFVRKDLGFADAPALEATNDTRLRAFLFRSRKSFDQWHLDSGEEVPSRGVLAYYTPVHQMIILHADLDPGQGSGVAGVALDTATFLHEDVHLLFDWYQRYYCDRAGKHIPEGWDALSPTRATPDTLFWFQEGLADYFAAARPIPGRDDDWEPGQPDRVHLDSLARARLEKQEWKCGEFLFADQAEIYDRAERKNWGRRGADNLKALMYAHGWCAVHYFLHGDGGKWRGKFLEYVRREMRGDHFRAKLEDLKRDLPGFADILKANPDFEDAIRDRKDMVIALTAFLQHNPEFAKRLRTLDFLDAFGLPKDPADPRVTAWIAEVDAGFRKHADEMLAGRGKGK